MNDIGRFTIGEMVRTGKDVLISPVGEKSLTDTMGSPEVFGNSNKAVMAAFNQGVCERGDMVEAIGSEVPVVCEENVHDMDDAILIRPVASLLVWVQTKIRDVLSDADSICCKICLASLLFFVGQAIKLGPIT